MAETNPSMNEQPGAENQDPGVRTGMTRKSKLIVLAVVMVIVVAGGYLANRYWIKPVTAQQASSGDYPKAPAFNLNGFFGQKVSLAQYRGKVVLLDFWATWCGPCQMEIPGFIRLQRRYGSQGFQVLGIVMRDQPQNVAGFYKQFGMNYPVAMGNESLAELYGGIVGLPTTFLIGRDGRIYSKIPGAMGEDFFEPAIKTLLAASPDEEVKNFHPMEGSEPTQVETPAQANSPVPGIDVSKLTKSELADYEGLLSKQQCPCGCQMTVLECRKTDPGCATSRQVAQDILAKLQKAKHTI